MKGMYNLASRIPTTEEVITFLLFYVYPLAVGISFSIGYVVNQRIKSSTKNNAHFWFFLSSAFIPIIYFVFINFIPYLAVVTSLTIWVGVELVRLLFALHKKYILLIVAVCVILYVFLYPKESKLIDWSTNYKRDCVCYGIELKKCYGVPLFCKNLPLNDFDKQSLDLLKLE